VPKRLSPRPEPPPGLNSDIAAAARRLGLLVVVERGRSHAEVWVILDRLTGRQLVTWEGEGERGKWTASPGSGYERSWRSVLQLAATRRDQLAGAALATEDW
jgi:hypothetical protein